MGCVPDKAISRNVSASQVAAVGREDLRRQEQFGGERVNYRLPFITRRVDAEIAGVLVAHYEMTQFVGGSRAPAPRIASEANNSRGNRLTPCLARMFGDVVGNSRTPAAGLC